MGFQKPLIGPYLSGGYVSGGWLTSHDFGYHQQFQVPKMEVRLRPLYLAIFGGVEVDLYRSPRKLANG